MDSRISEYRREACPVCGHLEWCGRREDGLVLCKRPPTRGDVPGFTYMGMADDGITGKYVEVGREYGQSPNPRVDARTYYVQASPGAASMPAGESCPEAKIDSFWLAANYPRLVSELSDERRAALALALGLPISSLDALEIGWWGARRWWNPKTQQHEGEPGCWTFPECDARDQIIGLGLRWPAGRKGQLAGGRRGLILPKGWRELPDPVLVVEGPSDVLAGRAIGLNVVGRPSNSGGAEWLMLACNRKQAIIIGENDRKPDGRWPGKEGAEAVAAKLGAFWKRPVPTAFTPDDAKDLRAWVLGKLAALARPLGDSDIEELSRRFLDAIQPPDVLLMAGPPSRRGGKPTVKAFRWSDATEAGPFFSDKLEVDSAQARGKFAAALAELVPAADVETLQGQLLGLKVPEPTTRGRSPGHSPSSPPAADAIAGEPQHARPRIQGNERQLRAIRADALEHSLFLRSGLCR